MVMISLLSHCRSNVFQPVYETHHKQTDEEIIEELILSGKYKEAENLIKKLPKEQSLRIAQDILIVFAILFAKRAKVSKEELQDVFSNKANSDSFQNVLKKLGSSIKDSEYDFIKKNLKIQQTFDSSKNMNEILIPQVLILAKDASTMNPQKMNEDEKKSILTTWNQLMDPLKKSHDGKIPNWAVQLEEEPEERRPQRIVEFLQGNKNNNET